MIFILFYWIEYNDFYHKRDEFNSNLRLSLGKRSHSDCMHVMPCVTVCIVRFMSRCVFAHLNWELRKAKAMARNFLCLASFLLFLLTRDYGLILSSSNLKRGEKLGWFSSVTNTFLIRQSPTWQDLHRPYARHHNPLLIINRSWILTLNKARILRYWGHFWWDSHNVSWPWKCQ